MEAVMAEMANEEELRDLDDDIEFVNENDEQDVFGSDFESTDDEAEQQAADASEVQVQEEERRVKKAARTRLDKITAAAHAKHSATFNAEIQSPAFSSRPKLRPRGRAEDNSGASAEVKSPKKVLLGRSKASKIRTSKRKHTVLSTTALVTRLKESAKKKAAQPKRTKAETRMFTQGELIASALDTEEGNIREHRDYLKNESEKRKRARVVRTIIEGPKLRWVSRKEEEKVPIPPPTPVFPTLSDPLHYPTNSVYRNAYGSSGTLFTPTTYTYAADGLKKTTIATPSTATHPSTSSTYSFPGFSHYQQSYTAWSPIQQQAYYGNSLTSNSKQPTFIVQTASDTRVSSYAQPNSPTVPEPEYRSETVSKAYLVHELGQEKGTPKPSWSEHMQVVFGDHVKWDEVKVFMPKNRPLSRPRQTCAITGRQAHYIDPRSGVPYADSAAFTVLTQLLQHEFVWNPDLGSYMDRADTK